MCIAGEDIWHLDCERYKAAAGIRTGQWRRKEEAKQDNCSIFVCLYSDSDASSEDSQSRSRTHSITTPSPTGACMSNDCYNIVSDHVISILLIVADFGSRSRQSSTKMSRESSAGEPKVIWYMITVFMH